LSRLIRSFAEAAGLMSRGAFNDKVDADLKRVVKALEELGPEGKGKARITVKLDLSYVAGQFSITPSVEAKMPADKGFPPTAFWSVDGALTVEHPSQIDMFPHGAETRGAAKA